MTETERFELKSDIEKIANHYGFEHQVKKMH